MKPVITLRRFVSVILMMSGLAGVYAVADDSHEIVTVLDTGISKETAVSKAAVGSNSVTVNTKNLNPGLYLLHIYARDSRGVESPSVTRLVYVTERETVAGAEYFIDSDPGKGKGHPLNTATGGAIYFSVPTGNLEVGLHTLYVRSRDAAFNWSETVSKKFLVTRNSAGIEWFYDKDPGIGKANQAEPDESGVVLLPTVNLTPGVHTLSVRCHDIPGNWSPTVTHLLYVTERVEFEASEYFVDNDPGAGKATPIVFDDKGNSSLVISTANLSIGNHNLTIRGKDSAGNWYIVFSAPFEVTDGSGVNSVNWVMDVAVTRKDGSVILQGGNIESNSRVEIFSMEGILLYSGTWSNSDSPLEINLNPSYRNCILNIITADGKRLVKRIR